MILQYIETQIFILSLEFEHRTVNKLERPNNPATNIVLDRANLKELHTINSLDSEMCIHYQK